ncbi:MAG TPA: aldolase/citrate lyase family protein [Candidatus Limnocylindrales bacterium]|nr:aldolase/citrate lyase family protein [Candidatus Limnocylindrales bacterium]
MSPRGTLAEAVAAAQERRAALLPLLAAHRTELPLRFWRQAAHYTTPASDGVMARKAVEGGTAPMGRLLERFGVTPVDLAERLGAPLASVEALLARPERAPLVMLDAEDALALRDDVTAAGQREAVAALAEADWAGDGPSALRFYRPPGIALGGTAESLAAVLEGLAERGATDRLDGIVYPKVEQPEEIEALYAFLDAAEAAVGIAPGSIRVAVLVESGWAAARLPDIALAAAPRLAAIVYGLADHAADIGLPAIAGEHDLATWVRCQIVNVAGALGVPAIDGMTLAYPVSDSRLDAAADRERFLSRVVLCHSEALRARDLGMLGKWVGHPAQLFACLLAFAAAWEPEALEAEAGKLEAYRWSVEHEGRGATIIGGVMSDRATDRHARTLLRRAVAQGRFEPARAAALGVISDAERREAEPIWLATEGRT